MKYYFLDKWLLPEAQVRTKVVAYGSEMAVMTLQGEHLFCPGSVGDNHIVDLIIQEGELTLTANGVRMTLQAPAYIDFIGSKIWSWQDLSTSPDFKGRMFGMTEPFFREMIDMLNVKIGNRLFDYMQRPFWSLEPEDICRLCRLLDIISDTMENPCHISLRDFLQNMLRAYMSELMDIVFRRRKLSKDNDAQSKSGLLLHFIYLLNNHYQQHHEVKWYAEQLGVSPNVLSIALKNAYGKNANTLIDERLLEKAQQYLSDRRYSIQQVADMLNFSDQSAFGKFFKRITGISPKSFKEGKR